MIFAHVFSTTLPNLPPDHPLSPYTIYMLHTVTELRSMLYLRIVVDAILLVVIFYFLWWDWKFRHTVNRLVEISTQRVEMTENLLRIIKGWTVVEISKRESSTQELKSTMEDVIPSRTADKVMERIQEHADSVNDSGKLPVIKPPPVSPAGG